MRSLCFVVQRAVSEIFPGKCLTYDYSLPNGLYAEIREPDCNPGEKPVIVKINDRDVEDIRTAAKRLISADIPFIKRKTGAEEAARIFNANLQPQKAELLESLGRFTSSI